jgi:RNA polymerase sigma-70 factor (ECF subfamily)
VIDALWDPERLAAATPPEPTAPADLVETRLLADLRRGEVSAFEELYRRQVSALYAFALRLSCRPVEAEELTQEVFVRAWEARGTFASLSHFRNWLRRVTVNEWINRIRRRHHPLTLDADDGVADAAAALASPSAPPGLRLDLERALAHLSPRLRAVLLLFDLYGLDHAEIGELLGMTVGASKVQLHRARRRLRELYRSS